MELRDELSQALKEAVCFHPDLANEEDWLEAADRILALPRIKEALEFLAFRESIPPADYSNASTVQMLGRLASGGKD
jgi:hypothetical protein